MGSRVAQLLEEDHPVRIVEQDGRLRARLDTDALPDSLRRRLAEGSIRRLLTIGQGTAAVAGNGRSKTRELTGRGVDLHFAGHTHGSVGIVLTSSNMPEWDRMPLRDVVAERLGFTVEHVTRRALALVVCGFLATALLSNHFVWYDLPNLVKQLCETIDYQAASLRV